MSTQLAKKAAVGEVRCMDTAVGGAQMLPLSLSRVSAHGQRSPEVQGWQGEKSLGAGLLFVGPERAQAHQGAREPNSLQLGPQASLWGGLSPPWPLRTLGLPESLCVGSKPRPGGPARPVLSRLCV